MYDAAEDDAFRARDAFWRGKGMGPTPSQDEIDEYVNTHKALSRWMLDVAFPNSDTITLYRGTTDNEVQEKNRHGEAIKGDWNKLPDWGEEVTADSNPISSWTMKPEVAFRFAAEQSRNNWLLDSESYEEVEDEMQGGTFTTFDRNRDSSGGRNSIRNTMLLKSEVPKDDIFTHFGSYAYHGNEKEFIVINNFGYKDSGRGNKVESWDWRDSAEEMATALDTERPVDYFEDELPEDISSYTWTDWAKEWDQSRLSVHPRLWDTLDDSSKESIDPYYEEDNGS